MAAKKKVATKRKPKSGQELVAAKIVNAAPPAKLGEQPITRETFGMSAIMAECFKNETKYGELCTPAYVMAQVLTPPMIKKFGLLACAQFALEIEKFGAGGNKGVTINADNANILSGHSDISVSDTERIFSAVIAERQAPDGKELGET
jgi:hypothetical protein